MLQNRPGDALGTELTEMTELTVIIVFTENLKNIFINYIVTT